MSRYIWHRILMLIPVLIGVVVVVFTINYFSTVSPAIALLGGNATPENIVAKEHELGLDRPYFVQLGSYFWGLISRGDLGTSYTYNVSVWSLVAPRIKVTFIIGFFGTLFSVVIGVPLGMLAAIKQNTLWDYSATTLAVVMAAFPPFWLCLLLMLFFSVKLGWLPISGIKTWKGYILPIIASGVVPVGMTMRMTRSSILEVIRQDYIRTARAKGVKEKTVIWKHVMKNALIPVVTVVGMSLGFSLTGSIICETIFNVPGLGLLMNTSISQRDFITTQSCVLIAAFIVSSMTLITDIVYAFVDPRIKAQYRSYGKRHVKGERT
ncbi:MAG: ABC transporter permease [Oscillospiraceae bacterium]|nr:ABC transporter permease [Oscillospiraceae bacterium]